MAHVFRKNVDMRKCVFVCRLCRRSLGNIGVLADDVNDNRMVVGGDA